MEPWRKRGEVRVKAVDWRAKDLALDLPANSAVRYGRCFGEPGGISVMVGKDNPRANLRLGSVLPPLSEDKLVSTVLFEQPDLLGTGGSGSTGQGEGAPKDPSPVTVWVDVLSWTFGVSLAVLLSFGLVAFLSCCIYQKRWVFFGKLSLSNCNNMTVYREIPSENLEDRYVLHTLSGVNISFTSVLNNFLLTTSTNPAVTLVKVCLPRRLNLAGVVFNTFPLGLLLTLGEGDLFLAFASATASFSDSGISIFFLLAWDGYFWVSQRFTKSWLAHS